MTDLLFPKAVFSAFLLSAGLSAAPPEKLELAKGQHVAIVGNGLADRMQHHAWLETLIQSRFPTYNLVFRNLAVAGDEVVTRLRSDDFGTPDKWLKKSEADVILAFFGFNESFASYAGVEKFKADLDKWIKGSRAQKYNGKGAPQLVLFSPIAEENLKDPNFSDGSTTNANLLHYTDAMAEVAKANDVLFIDLFKPSQELYAKASKPLTIDGVHLTEAGDKALAPLVFGGPSA